jgi:hypothetical protein
LFSLSLLSLYSRTAKADFDRSPRKNIVEFVLERRLLERWRPAVSMGEFLERWRPACSPSTSPEALIY